MGVFDPEKLVHEPRVEDHGGASVARDYVLTQSGEYVCESGILRDADSDAVFAAFKVGHLGDWESVLDGYEVVDTGLNREPGFYSRAIGVDASELVDTRENRWVELYEDGWDVHLNNLDSRAPSALRVSGTGSVESLGPVAAVYAGDLAYHDLEPGQGAGDEIRVPVEGEEDLWRDLFRKSLGSAFSRMEEVGGRN